MSIRAIEQMRGQKPAEPGKDYIGLQKLIEMDRVKEIDRTPADFDQVQEALERVSGFHIPDRFAEKLNFRDLKWLVIAHKDANSALLIGVRGAHNRKRRFEIGDAKGVVEVARHEWGGVNRPNYLALSNIRVGGVYSSGGQNWDQRPVAVSYREVSPHDQKYNVNSATSISVGFFPREIGESPDKDLRPEYHFTHSLPTDSFPEGAGGSRYDTGLITKAMVEGCWGYGRGDMTKALRLGAAYYPSESVYVSIPHEAQCRGIYGGVFDGDQGVVGFNYRPRDESLADRVHSWGVTFPLQLQK